MHPLEKRFDAEENAYHRICKSSEAKVLRWEYWDNFYWHWDPAELKTHQDEWWKKHPPKHTSKGKALYSYGYDENGRVVVIRRGLPGKELSEMTQEFIRYSGTTLTSSTFFGEDLLEVSAGETTGSRTIRVENVGGRGGSGWQTIEWSADQVVRIVFGEFGKKPALEWCYDKKGKLTGMYDLPRKLRLPKGVNIKTLTKMLHEGLVKLIPKVIAKARITEPAYSLVLAYDGEGNGVMPPSLGIGLDSERKNWVRSKGKGARDFIWNAAEFRHYETKQTTLPADKKFEQACEWYNQLLDRKSSDKPARELLNKVASDLAKLDWKGKLNTTEDFVVFAVDYEGDDLNENLKRTIPAKTLASLKAAKLL